MRTDGHDMGKDTVGHTPPANQHGAGGPGYETTDVNVGGVAVFLAGLSGSLLIFFVLCFAIGRVINDAIAKEDGDVNKWHQASTFQGARTTGGKRQNLASNPEMQQRELQQMTSTFPTPRLDIDDGNQATADLHAREDLLLDHYSSVDGQAGTVRIPIERAMQLIAQKGLPVAAASPTAAPQQFAGDAQPVLTAPLTRGFARTGYELDTIETRAQKLNFGKAEATAAASPSETR